MKNSLSRPSPPLMRVASFLFFLAGMGPLHAQDMRTWTDDQGRQVEASIAGFQGQAVQLRLADGRIIPFPIERLSEADQYHAREQREKGLPVPELNDAIFIVTHGSGSGSGFLAQMDGQAYLLTNHHVAAGSEPIIARSINGTTLKLDNRIDVARGLDLVRIPVFEGRGLKINNQIRMDEAITAYGNSGGASVLTRLPGKILGIGPRDIEISAEIIPGNSGGPVINAAGKVVGVATYLSGGHNPTDWTVRGTRFAQTRRFAIRLPDNIEWDTMDMPTFLRESAMIAQANRQFYETIRIARTMINQRLNRIETSDGIFPELDNWVVRYNTEVDRAGRTKQYVTPEELNNLNRDFTRRFQHHGRRLVEMTRQVYENRSMDGSRLNHQAHRMAYEEICERYKQLADALEKAVAEASSQPFWSFRP